MAKKAKDANYDYKTHAPSRPMGTGSYANMPEKPIITTFSNRPEYRDGISNNPVINIDLISHVDENMREVYDHD